MTNIRAMLFCGLAMALCATAASADQCRLKMVGTMDIYTGSNGRLLVPVTVEGQSGYFRLDLGIPISGILESSVKNLNLRRLPIDNATVRIDGKQLKWITEADLNLGGAIGPVRLGITPSLEMPDVREVGVLGYDVLRNFDVDLDLAHDKLNLFSPDHCAHQVVYWTQTAPVAALPIQTPNRYDFFVVMQLDGKDVETKILMSSAHASLSTRVAQEKFGIPVPAEVGNINLSPYPPFKTLSVDGLTITSPVIYPFLDQSKGNCNGRSYFGCFGSSELFIGLSELRKLHIFFDFSEKTLYATAADAK